MIRAAQSSVSRSIRNNAKQFAQQHRKHQQQNFRRHPFATTSTNSTTTTPSKSVLLEADTGVLGTSIYHTVNSLLTVGTMIYLLAPPSFTEGVVDTTFSLLLSVGIGVHSWIGLNYVAVDYVPKVSKALLPASRVACAGMGVVTVLGLTKISLGSDGGIKGLIRKGLWNGKKETEDKNTKAI